jgi:hypothetical protein
MMVKANITASIYYKILHYDKETDIMQLNYDKGVITMAKQLCRYQIIFHDKEVVDYLRGLTKYERSFFITRILKKAFLGKKELSLESIILSSQTGKIKSKDGDHLTLTFAVFDPKLYDKLEFYKKEQPRGVLTIIIRGLVRTALSVSAQKGERDIAGSQIISKGKNISAPPLEKNPYLIQKGPVKD